MAATARAEAEALKARLDKIEGVAKTAAAPKAAAKPAAAPAAAKPAAKPAARTSKAAPKK